MIAALALAASLTAHHCVIESRDHATTRAGQVALFEVDDTCLMRGLFVVADDGRGHVLTGANYHTGHDLIVSIRIPRHTRPGTIFYAFGYSPARNLYRPPIVDFEPIRITR